MTIRDCLDADAEGVLDLLPQLWPDARLDRRLLADTFRALLQSPHQRSLCAEVDSRVVGFLSMSVDASLWTQGSLARIDELVVDGEHRRRGIGRRLLDRAMEIASSLGCDRIAMDSAEHRSAAHRFYEGRGFERLAVMFSKRLGPTSDASVDSPNPNRGRFTMAEKEDELFLVVEGRLAIHLRDRVVELDEGEYFVVPRGVEHKPVAEGEAHVLLFEPGTTLNTGDVRNELTIDDPPRL